MGKSDIPRNDRMSPQDRRAFDRWLDANAVISLIFAFGIAAMALAGAYSAGPRDAVVANNTKASDLAASEQRRGRTGALSADNLATRDKPLRP